MRKRACSIVGVAAFLIGGTQLFASTISPPDSDGVYMGSGIFTMSATFDFTSADLELDSSIVDDDGLVLSNTSDDDEAGLPAPVFNSAAAPATIVNNVGIFTPEPGSVAMLLIGAAGLAVGVFRRRNRG